MGKLKLKTKSKIEFINKQKEIEVLSGFVERLMHQNGQALMHQNQNLMGPS